MGSKGNVLLSLHFLERGGGRSRDRLDGAVAAIWAQEGFAGKRGVLVVKLVLLSKDSSLHRLSVVCWMVFLDWTRDSAWSLAIVARRSAFCESERDRALVALDVIESAKKLVTASWQRPWP